MSVVWTCVLYCFNCDETFVINRVSLAEIYLARTFFFCPHCDRTPSIKHPHRVASITVANLPFRKGEDGSVWHYSEYCSQWPVSNFVELDFPPVGEICNQCRVLVEGT